MNCIHPEPEWLARAGAHLRSAPDDLTPKQWAQRIHEALEIAQAPKYATAESQFTFAFSGVTEKDLAEIRKHLSVFENLIVKIQKA